MCQDGVSFQSSFRDEQLPRAGDVNSLSRPQMLASPTSSGSTFRSRVDIRELFRGVHGVPKPHLALASVASQFDPRVRARDAARALAAEGIHIFSYRENKPLEKLVAKKGRRTFVLACGVLQVRKSDTR